MASTAVEDHWRLNVKKQKKLAAGLAVVMGLATLAGTSAFADSRPQRGTSDRDGVIRRDHERRDRDRYDRDRRDGDRYEDRSREHRAQPYHTRGRVTRVHPHRGGYHVWVGDVRHPFHVPNHYYRRDRFRVGVFIDIGGWYNPRGYYDYDHRYGDSRYNDRRSYSRGILRGTVESVDGNRRSFVMRNDATGSYVTVLPRGRRVYVRPGDYVEVDGTWTRSGYFTAYDIDWLERSRWDDRDDRWED